MSRYEELFPYWPFGRAILPFLIDSMGREIDCAAIIPLKNARGVFFVLDKSCFYKLCQQYIPPDHIRTFQRCIDMMISEIYKKCRQEVTDILNHCGCDALGSTIDVAAEKMMSKMILSGDPRVKTSLRQHCALEE